MAGADNETHLWFGAFGDLASEDQMSVAQLLDEGGAIEGTISQITHRLKRTRKLAILRLMVTDRIVGVAALKTPKQNYRADKFANAGVSIAGFETAPELGYVVVAQCMRGMGLSHELVHAIAKDIQEPTFATTDNDTMKRNLQGAGFTRAGREWPGQRGVLSLWTITP